MTCLSVQTCSFRAKLSVLLSDTANFMKRGTHLATAAQRSGHRRKQSGAKSMRACAKALLLEQLVIPLVVAVDVGVSFEPVSTSLAITCWLVTLTKTIDLVSGCAAGSAFAPRKAVPDRTTRLSCALRSVLPLHPTHGLHMQRGGRECTASCCWC